MTLTSHRRGSRYGAEPEEECAALARQVLPEARWVAQGVSPKKLPTWASFFDTDRCLVVVVHPGATQVEKALVYGLQHAAGRHLHLVLPSDPSTADAIHATLIRKAFLAASVAVWTYDGELVLSACEALAPSEAIERSRTSVSRFKADAVGAGIDWIEEFAGRLTALGLVADRERGIWYFRGARMVVVESTTSKVRIVVGATRGAVEPERFELPAGFAPDGWTFARIEGRITEDVASDWFTARPQQYAEHDLQGRITAGEVDLGWTPIVLVREYPGHRATGRPGFIDFLGVDAEGVLHVVETKLGDADEMLILQGLDYWIWVHANRSLVASDLRVSWSDVRLDFVLAPKSGSGVRGRRNRYWDSVFNVLAPEVIGSFIDV